MRGFYRYLLRDGLISEDPTLQVELPQLGRPLPKSLSEADVEALLAAPELDDPLGLRDRAMLEVLYACGLRVTELVSLTLEQVNLRQGVLRVLGQGQQASAWCRSARRPSPGSALPARGAATLLLDGKPSDVLFPSLRGEQMTRQTFWHRIKRHARRRRASIKPLSPHTLRHAFATHLLNHGADLRVVQSCWAISDLSTTQIYTHIARARLQELHAQHHPRGEPACDALRCTGRTTGRGMSATPRACPRSTSQFIRPTRPPGVCGRRCGLAVVVWRHCHRSVPCP